MAAGKIGVLAVNLGSPTAPNSPEVRAYLREFLFDPRVIDIHPVPRWLLVNGVIAPFRAPRSAAAYRAIWTEGGSPLLVHGRDLVKALGDALGPPFIVELAMRYGPPSIEAGLRRLRAADCQQVVLFPLYPQYAASSTGSTIELAYRVAAHDWNTSFLSVVPPFFDDAGFVHAWTQVGRPVLESFTPDHVLLSFHGLPQRHIRKSDPTGRHCLNNEHCCDAIVPANRNCYRAHCFATARAMVQSLSLSPDSWTVSFQSRLGRDPWIPPYTDLVIPQLVQRGVKRLAVFCPAFVADCLETLEEIGIRAREQFVAAGGEDLCLVPSLNSHPAWVAAAATLVRRQAGRSTPEMADEDRPGSLASPQSDA